MPKIVKTSSQETALKEIQENLKVLDALNGVLEDSLDNCRIRVIGNSNGKTVNEQFCIPYGQISVALKDYRKKLINDITSKSRTYSIILDENDLAIVENEKQTVHDNEEYHV